MKKKLASEDQTESPAKKIKLDKKKKVQKENGIESNETTKVKKPKLNDDKGQKVKKNSSEKPSKFSKTGKKGDPTNLKEARAKKFLPKDKLPKTSRQPVLEKVEDWNEFKKEKKELKLKRRQAKVKDVFDVIVRAKQIGEQLRIKNIKEDKRNQLINELHTLLKGKNHYPKFALAHDTARIVQWLLKYASDFVVNQISKELIPVTVDMLQSKYGIYCVKRLLKYGQSEIRSAVIDAMLGHSVKLTSHAVSAPVVEYAYSTWATPLQKQYLIQEFYGDLYKNSKDKNVKHLRDVYKDNGTLKAATLGSTKANIQRILNKELLNSGLVQSVLCQFFSECSAEDRNELISQLATHVVVLSNSKDGARAVMQCIWHGSNKDRKAIMKSLKEHIVELSKHEHGHCTVITLLDSADDTVLLHKIILAEILKNAKDLAVSEWGRKVLLWLVAPADSTLFHPVFVNELKAGRESSTSKKSEEIRRKEILTYSISTLLNLVTEDAEFWLKNASLAIEMLAIVKAGSAEELEKALKSIVKVVTNVDWKIQENDKEIPGIEHAGIHMALKKLAQNDKVAVENSNPTFGDCLTEEIDEKTMETWLKYNRGCFVLVAVFENNSEKTQNNLKTKLKKHLKLLKGQNFTGAKILMRKIS